MSLPDWRGETVAIVGSGESAKDAGVEALRGRCRVIAINTSFLLVPWADILYAADGPWWDRYSGARAFEGRRLTASEGAARVHRIEAIKVLAGAEEEQHQLQGPSGNGAVGHGGFSGFQMVDFAIQTGSRRLLLIGFDCVGGHWHGDHPLVLRNPRPAKMQKWAVRLDRQARRLAEWGVMVVNCSPISLLAAYPKMSIAEALREQVAA